MLVDQPLRLVCSVLHRKSARDAERIEAMEITPSRQDRRRAQKIAAGCWTHEFAVQRMQDRGQFMILLEDAIDAGQFRVKRQRSVVFRGQSFGRLALHQRFEDRSVQTRAVRSIGNRLQHLDPLFDRRRLTNDVQSMRNQGVFELKHGFRQFADGRGRIHPGRLGLGQFQCTGLGLDQCPEIAALRILTRSESTPTCDRGLQLDQPLVEPGMCDGRRKIAD